ncbi:MAG TPA: trigger factor [Candidatus Paceibacterota bacterium]|nr:trigger factor [Candidatus Paceibacterota bacterium]
MSSHDHKHSYKIKVKKLSNVKVEIEGEIPADEFALHVKSVLADAVKNAEIPGFRKGTAPEKLIKDKIGMENILYDAARECIAHAYEHILHDEKIDAIGRPEITITKIAEGNPLGFKIASALLPEIKDFDYASVAKKENKKEMKIEEVTEKDLIDTIEAIKKNYVTALKLEKAPELDDEFVKKLGEFTSVADFKTKLKENIAKEKEQRTKEKRRVGMIDALVGALSIEVPEILIENELSRMVSEMQSEIMRMGLKWDEYLKQLKKTEDDLKKEWNSGAIKRVKLDLAIDYIAKKEKISADKKKVETELAYLKENHKDIDLARAESYLDHVYQNQAVFEFLETI